MEMTGVVKNLKWKVVSQIRRKGGGKTRKPSVRPSLCPKKKKKRTVANKD